MDLRSLRRRANGLARTALAPVPLGFWQGVFPKDAIALCYHMISDERLPHFRLYPHKNSRQFESDVQFAKERTITYRQLVEHRLRGATLPHNRLIFTFDDGFAECYDVIRPVLLRHGVDAVFFVTTDFLDDRASFPECTLSQCLSVVAALPDERVAAVLATANVDEASLMRDVVRYRRALARFDSALLPRTTNPARRTLYFWLLGLGDDDDEAIARACSILGVDPGAYAAQRPIFLSSAQVRRLAADGFTIGAHGLNHRLLENRDPEAIEAEILASCEVVRELTGQERVPFAFPHSGLAVDRDVIAAILGRNPSIELIFDSGCLRRDPRFIVNRVFTDMPPTADATNVPTALRDSWSIPSAWFRSA